MASGSPLCRKYGGIVSRILTAPPPIPPPVLPHAPPAPRTSSPGSARCSPAASDASCSTTPMRPVPRATRSSVWLTRTACRCVAASSPRRSTRPMATSSCGSSSATAPTRLLRLRTMKSCEIFPRSPEDVEFLPGRCDVLRRWIDEGYQLFFVSNQSGVASGTPTQEAADAAFARTAGAARPARHRGRLLPAPRLPGRLLLPQTAARPRRRARAAPQARARAYDHGRRHGQRPGLCPLARSASVTSTPPSSSRRPDAVHRPAERLAGRYSPMQVVSTAMISAPQEVPSASSAQVFPARHLYSASNAAPQGGA